MSKRIILTCITVLMTMALLFMGCVQDKSDDQETAGIDFSDYLEIRTIEGKQEMATIQSIYGVELLVSNCDNSKLDIPNGFKIIETRDEKTVLSIAFGKKIKKDMVILKLPIDAEITVLSIVNNLEWDKTTKDNGIAVLLGDFNHDSYVNLDDFMLFKNKYRLETGNSGYTTEYDIYPAVQTFTEPEWATIYSENNPDGIVDLYDFVLFTINYRKSVNREPTLEWVKPESVNVSGESTISWNAIDYDKNDLDFNILIYQGGVLLKSKNLSNSTDTTCTFVEGDEYTLELTATDVVNAEVTPKSTELSKTFRVNIRPTITKVTEDVDYVYTDTITFEWEAADQDGTIDHMAYRLDEDVWQNTQECSLTLENYSEDEHTFSVKAVDNQGGESEVASWTFTYLNQRLELEHKNSRLYVSGYGLENVRGLTFIVDYDQQKVDMGAASLESEGTNGELLYTADESGLYIVELGFFDAESSIDGTLVSIAITNAVDNSSVTIDEATVLKVENGDEIIAENIDFIGTTIHGVPVDGEYKLTVIASPTNAGSVCIDNSSWDTMATMTVGAWENVMVQASPSIAYTLEYWTKDGEVINENNDFLYTMPATDATLVASFQDIIVEFTDPVLEYAIRNHVDYTGEYSGPIFKKNILAITELDIRESGIESLGGLNHLSNIATLVLADNLIGDISPVNDLKNLVYLDFSENNVVSITALENLKKLVELKFNRNRVNNVNALGGLVNLQKLEFENNTVSDISTLSNLTNLIKLNIKLIGVADISPLNPLNKLEFLDIAYNLISDLSPLEDLTSLVHLEIWFNKITDISSLANLTNLEYLDLGSHGLGHPERGNHIQYIFAIENLIRLEYLDIYDNSVYDIAPLVNNTGFSNGDYVDLRNNNLDRTDGSKDMQDIQTLIDRGVDVDY